MGFVEIISFDENGVTKKNLNELSFDERLSLEVDVDLALAGLEKTQLLCVTCYKPIPSGLGHSYCETHKPNFKSCELCNQEMRGLYCIHCFTGRILTTPSGEKYLERK